MRTVVTGYGYKSSASHTRPNDTTPYTAGDVVGTSPAANIEFTGCSTIDGGHIIILGATMRIDVSAVPSGMSGFRLHLYDSAPTAITDNTAYDLVSGDRSKYLGYITIDAPSDLGSTIWSENININKKVKLAAGSSTLYGILETTGAYTPTAQAVKTIALHIVGV